MDYLLKSVNWWEAGIFIALLVLAWTSSWVVGKILRNRLGRLEEARGNTLPVIVMATCVPLLRWGLVLLAVGFALEVVELAPLFERYVGHIIEAGFAILFAYVGGRAVWVAFNHWSEQAEDSEALRARATLAPVLAKACIIFFYTIAFLLALQNFGYDVAGLIAGLGIGGVAIALAAKDTVANVFGSVAVLIDRPFTVGDLVQIGTTEGTVEKIGLRSTRIRTYDGFLVSVPNQNLTTCEAINISRRPTRRAIFTLGLVYDLSADQMREAVEMLRHFIGTHPKTSKVWVHWKEFGPCSLDIQVIYWSNALPMEEYLEAVQELNCGIKERFDAAGFGFAFPTQTVILQKEEG